MQSETAMQKTEKGKSEPPTSGGSSFQWVLVGHQQLHQRSVLGASVFASCAPLFTVDSLCGSIASPCRDCPVPASAFPGSGIGYLLHLAVFRAWVFAPHVPIEQSPLGKLFQAGNCCCSWSGNRMGKISFFFKKSSK